MQHQARIAKWLTALVLLAIAALVAMHSWFPRPVPADVTAPSPMPQAEPARIPPRAVELPRAIGLGLVRGRYESNGHNRLRVHVQNLYESELVITVPAGMLLEAGDSQIITVRQADIELAPGLQLSQEIPCAATRIANHTAEQPYLAVGGSISQLSKLLAHIASHPELSLPAVQTAVLALMDNPPLSAFAKFPLLVESESVLGENPSFRVDTRHLVQALQMLKDIGHPAHRLALTVDPQLQAEAMVDPMSHAEALKYYEIPPEKEYGYWQNLLLNGHESLRHYALHGIAKYFPEIALQMLPKWARARQLDVKLREAAIRSLAGAARPETIPVLEHLHWDMQDSELIQAAHDSLLVVRQDVFHPDRFQLPIAFRYTLPPPPDFKGL